MAVKKSTYKFVSFSYLNKLLNDETEESIFALDNLIEDIHKDKALAIQFFINHVDAYKFIEQLIKLLSDTNTLVVGNTAFIIGTLCEYPNGRERIISTFSNYSKHDEVKPCVKLIELLDSSDNDVIMNVAGTLGTLLETFDGRQFIMSHVKSIDRFLQTISGLLQSSNLWTGSNSALIIARLCIDDEGRNIVINYKSFKSIIENLIASLGEDNAGRGMNSAFALGRLIDNNNIREVWDILMKSKTLHKLLNMILSSDSACVKNACFCVNAIELSAHTTSDSILLTANDVTIKKFMKSLLQKLKYYLQTSQNYCEFNDDNVDEETVWFCILILKTLTRTVSGVKLLRKFNDLIEAVKKCKEDYNSSNEILDESEIILNRVKPIENPSCPQLEGMSPYKVRVSWYLPANNHLDLPIRSLLYYTYLDDEVVLAYRGPKSEVEVSNLEPNTIYRFTVKFVDDVDESDMSPPTVITTIEDVPSAPINLRTTVCTPTQFKLNWDCPLQSNGNIKFYTISISHNGSKITRFLQRYLSRSKVGNKDNKTQDQTAERISIISGLKPETKYQISVCAVNNAGKGENATIEAFTSDSGEHAPNRPNVVILGRMEAHITWNPPEVLLGKLFRYEVRMNHKQIIYSGSNTYCKATYLRPDTDYSFTITAVTSEGKYESQSQKKRTPKDEYSNVNRAPLYSRKPTVDVGNLPRSNTSLVSVKTQPNKSVVGLNNSTISRRYSDTNAHLQSNYKSIQLPILRPSPSLFNWDTVNQTNADEQDQDISLDVFSNPLTDLTSSINSLIVSTNTLTNVTPSHKIDDHKRNKSIDVMPFLIQTRRHSINDQKSSNLRKSIKLNYVR